MANVNVAIRITSNYRGGPGFQKADKDVKKFRKNVGRAANSVRAFQFVLAGVAISTLTIWGKKLVDVASDLQLLQIRLAAVEGSTTAADKQFKSLFQRFQNVPFQLDAITDGFVRLRAAGVSTKDANRTINNLVDAVAVFGGSTQELQRATIGFQQVAGKGVLSMEELRQQIGESIPSAMAIMSRAAGITIGEFVEQVKNGTLSATEAFRLFNEGSEAAFAGFARGLSDTITGSFAGMKSKVRFAIGDLFNVRTDLSFKIAAFVQDLTEKIVSFIDSINQGDIDKFWESFIGVAQMIEGIVKALAAMITILGQLFGMAGNAAGPAAGTALIGGIIGAMLFGGPVGLGIAALILVNEQLKITDQILANADKRTRNRSPEQLAKVEKMTGRFARAAERRSAKAQLPGVLSNDAFNAMLAGPGQGDIFDPNKLPDLSEVERQFGLARQTKNRFEARQQPNVRGGLLGLSGAFGKLAEDMLTLADRAKIAAENTLTPWLKASDAFAIKFQKISDGLDKVKADFDEAAKNLEEEIKVTTDPGKKQQKIEELAEARLNAIKEIAKQEELLEKARAAVAKRANDLSERFVNKQISKLHEFRDASDLALGNLSPFQVGQRAIIEKGAETVTEIEKIAAALERVVLATGNLAAADALEEFRRQVAATAAATKADLGRTAEVHDLKMAQIALEGKEFKENAAEEMRHFRIQNDFGVSNLINSELTNEVLQRKADIQSNIRDIQGQILQAEIAIRDINLDPTQIANLEEKLRIWREMIAEMQVAKEKVSEEALLEQKLWTDLGQVIENGVGNAIEGLITGTKTLKQAMLDMWSSAIRAAAQYIVKLLIMKALGALSGGGFSFGLPGMGGGQPFALGGVFNGSVKPFARGDIIRGPTMFGLAGESGTEAIMPLKRGSDGKLGVAGGGGGDNYNITIQAMDTQTGAEFLMKNMGTIVQGVQHENSLNRGIRRGVN